MSAFQLFLANASSQITSGANAACNTACNKVTLESVFAGIANTLIFVVGAISVIMVIVGGLRYVTANGDAKAVSSAKDTILYAVVGVVVAIASYAIVNFVVLHVGVAAPPKK